MSKLHTPLQIGDIIIQHRIALAPLTRLRQDADRNPLPFVKDYYAQRASVLGTLLITEGLGIDPHIGSDDHFPGIYSASHIAAWKEITDAVHAKGSFIWAQIFSLGRAAKSQEGERGILSSNAIPIDAESPIPAEMTEKEIENTIKNFMQAARKAMEAGFDGVEIHGANGYLIDQFTQDTANKRKDKWGGSVENRSRFGLEVTKAVVAALGARRVGFRISPYSTFQAMCMDDPVPQFSHLVSELSGTGFAYLHVVTARMNAGEESDSVASIDFAIERWTNGNPVLVAGGLTPDSAAKLVDEEWKDRDVAVFGRYFIANPDLPLRLKHGLELAAWNRDTFYTHGEEGYTDYTFHPDFVSS
jgi:NADPH2 dehydrogenase